MMDNGGVMTAEKSIKLSPDASVPKIPFGADIQLSAADFSLISKAFFAEIGRKFV